MSSISAGLGHRWPARWYLRFDGSSLERGTFARSGAGPPSSTTYTRCELHLFTTTIAKQNKNQPRIEAKLAFNRIFRKET